MKNKKLKTVVLFLALVMVSTNAQTVRDIDGNVYSTVTIGRQVWMKKNLKTTRYADGTPIALVSSVAAWDVLNETSEAYCWLGDDIRNKDIYGALYTWAAAMKGAASSEANPSGVQGVCPTGWHLPSDAEWTELELYLGGNSIAGGKMKEIGTAHWAEPNTGATNKSGFTGLPGGFRSSNGVFGRFPEYGNWWSSTEISPTSAYYRLLNFGNASSYKFSYNKEIGFSVRCIRNK